jgi:phosphatidylserine/phosphatidylglycerophosphate/cardiolipin synthase-like enzyme
MCNSATTARPRRPPPPDLIEPAMSRSLLVLPEATAEPLLAAIGGAQKSLRIKMFLFSDPGLLDAVIAARKRGIDVKVMLNPARRSGETENEDSRRKLVEAGVSVLDSNPAFDLTHEKSMVVDASEAYVMSLNWETRNVSETRDYAVVTRHPNEVAEIAECFDADWKRSVFAPREGSALIWCNSNGRERFAHFIDRAQHTLWLQNERYQDAVIIERVVRAAGRGVKVHIVARPPHTLKKEKLIEGVGGLRIMADVGCKVHKLKHIRLHGKMMLADSASAIVGSVNLAPGSFDARRELAIEVDDAHVIGPLEKVAKHDWEHSEALDLTDEGLMADLEKRHKEASAADLVLDVHEEAHAAKHAGNGHKGHGKHG